METVFTVDAEGGTELSESWRLALAPAEIRVYSILSEIAEGKRPQVSSLRDLARDLEFSQNAVVKSIKKLSQLGLVKGLSDEY